MHLEIPHRIAIERHGAGKPLLLIMGIGGQLTQWPEEFVRGLIAAGFDTIAMDNRDIGLSAKFIDGGMPQSRRMIARYMLGLPVNAPYTLRDMAEDAAKVLAALEIDRAQVVGISMGSMIAQILAAEHPHLVERLTLFHTNLGLRRDLPAPKAIAALTGKPVSSRTAYEERFLHLFKTIGSPKLGRSDEELREYAARAYARNYHAPGFRRQMAAILATGNRTSYCRAIDCPTTIIHGRVDPLMPLKGARRVAKQIRNSRLCVFDELGHDLPEALLSDFISLIAEGSIDP